MFKKSIVLLLVLALVITAGLVGCGPKATPEAPQTGDQSTQTPAAEQKEMVLNWNLGSDPKTIDPQLNSAVDGGHILNNTFEGLMREVNGKLQPAMAESYTMSDDGLVYTFKLRDAKWSDGQPVKAQDFEYAWKRAADPATAAEYAFQMYYIKNGQNYNEGKATADDMGVKAIDDKTLEVTLDKPCAYFLDLTAFYTFMPVRKDMVDKGPDGSWARDPANYIGNGPFKMVEYTPGDKIVLVKNENYWNAASVKLSKIVATMIVEASTELTAFESSELDIIDDIPPQEIPRLKAEDKRFSLRSDITVYYYIFNVTKPPVDDVRVRKALSLAIDRKAIVEQVTKAGQTPAAGIVYDMLKDSTGANFREKAGNYYINPNAADVQQAKALLAEAGYPDGKGFPVIELMYNTNDTHKVVAEAIQEMWKQNLGIECTLANQEFAVFQDTRHQGNFTVARAGWGADYADPMTFLDLWTSYSGNNDAQWRVPEYDAIIEQAKKVQGPERDALLYQAEKMVMDNAIIAPIYDYTDPIMVQDKVKAWEKTLLGQWYFGNTYIEE